MSDVQAGPATPGSSTSASAGATTPSMTLYGRFRPFAPLGRLGRGLVYGTGLFLLRPLMIVLHRLVGWRREGTLAWAEGELLVESELFLLGASLRAESERLPASRVVSTATVAAPSAEPVVLGALAVTFSLVWGLYQIADGLYGRSFSLILLGVGAIAAGVAVDIGILWISRIFPDPNRYGVIIRSAEGRTFRLDGVQLETAQRFSVIVAQALGQSLGQAPGRVPGR